MESRRATISSYFNRPFLLLLIMGILGLTGCWSESATGPQTEPGEQDDESILAHVEQNKELSNLEQLIKDTGLDEKLSTVNSHTLFAPSDSAFDKLPEGFMDTFSRDQVQEILNYHMVSNIIPERKFEDQTSLETDQGDSLYVSVGSTVQLNQRASLTTADKPASNGVIQQVDNVLIPDTYLSVFGIIQKRYFLDKFACHCTSGRVNLDDVLENEDGEFTIFVPSDTAFMDSDVNINELSDEELEGILNYHVVNEKLISDELSDNQTLTMRNGEELTVSVAGDGTISLNDGEAIVQQKDLEGTNGVVYVIDSVLGTNQ